MMRAEVTRLGIDDDLKRGAGGIREIEFIAQSLQLIHGGRMPELRVRSLLQTLQALMQAELLSSQAGRLPDSALSCSSDAWSTRCRQCRIDRHKPCRRALYQGRSWRCYLGSLDWADPRRAICPKRAARSTRCSTI